jgi:hypothetical protein
MKLHGLRQIALYSNNSLAQSPSKLIRSHAGDWTGGRGRLQHCDDATASSPDRLYAAEEDWPLPATTTLRQSFLCVLAEVIASSQTLTSRSSISVDGGVAPHHQSPTSASPVHISADIAFRHGVLSDVAARLSQQTAHRPQSSSASRFTAGAAGFFDLIQSCERPEHTGETMSA